ncbi:MAG: SUF system Fe-S cluster assembly protein, partial [Phycisphaeraceae bacterium]
PPPPPATPGPAAGQVSIGHTERASQDSADPVARRDAQQQARDAQRAEAIAHAGGSIEDKVIAAIQEVYDPEIPVNIHELGLIYGVKVDDDANVQVTMTLTSPACPVAQELPLEVRRVVESVPEVGKATVELTFDPPWSQEMMSEAARLQLGLL